MSKTCKNCDHICVCGNPDAEWSDVCKEYWSGWHDAKEELPEVGEKVIVYCKDGENALVSINENKFWKFDIGNISTDYVIAWREIDEYEVEK